MRTTPPGRRALAACLAATLLLAFGCATPPPPRAPRTTVVLLPDEDGRVGALNVTTAAGTQRVDEAFAFSAAEGASAPSRSQALGRESVEATYGELLKAQPRKPVTFVLHFQLDKTLLTEASKAQIPAVLAAVRERRPTEITVFGHADASGTEKRNLRISAERARMVADLLKKDDPTLGEVDVQFFGDKAPLVPAEPGVAEPRNRRAEILIL